MDSALIVALVAAIAGPLLAYIGAVRRLSGRIGTSEASQLWEESRSIREDYADRIKELNQVLKRCEERIDLLESRNEKLVLENGKLERMLEEHEQTIAELRAQIHRLSEENERLRDENKDLKVRVGEIERHG